LALSAAASALTARHFFRTRSEIFVEGKASDRGGEKDISEDYFANFNPEFVTFFSLRRTPKKRQEFLT
jgi:stalled ribosome alternative rescue factor ArfA